MSPNVSVIYNNGTVLFTYSSFGSSSKRYDVQPYEKNIKISEKDVLTFLGRLKEMHIEEWEQNTYRNDDILDGMSWDVDIDISVRNNEKETFLKVKSEGYEVYPNGYDTFIAALEVLIRESIYSRTYNRDILALFMKDETKGEEARKKLFEKVSPMILEIVEGDINIDILDYDVKEIFYHYFNLLRIFGVSDADKEIMKHCVWASRGVVTEQGIDIREFMDKSLFEVSVFASQLLLSEYNIWMLDEKSKKDISMFFDQTRANMIYRYEHSKYCMRGGNIDFKALCQELAEIITKLLVYTCENKITYEVYYPKSPASFVGSVAMFLDVLEVEIKKIIEIYCCMRAYDSELLDSMTHNIGIMLARETFHCILLFVDTLHLLFIDGYDKSVVLNVGNDEIEELLKILYENNPQSDLLPLFPIFGVGNLCEQ